MQSNAQQQTDQTVAAVRSVAFDPNASPAARQAARDAITAAFDREVQSDDDASNETIPMRSVRIGDGTYEVLGTSRNCVIQPAYSSRGWNGPPVRDGWHLIVDGEYANTFATKRAALQACQRDATL